MFAVPFSRIFWKEYRVHRALWLSCLMIGCVVQLFFWWNIVLAPNQTAELFEVFVVLVPLMYAIGCGALLFASEREERTCEWLLALAAPPAPTLFAKLAFGVCSTLALQIAMEILSRLVLANATHHGEPNRFVYPLPYGLLILPWAVLGSLRSRQVMSSFLVMLFYVFFTSMVTPIVMFGFIFVFQNDSTILVPICGFLTVFLIVIGANLWFGWRWCQGRYMDGTDLTSLFARETRSTSVAGNTKVLDRLPVRTEYEQPWRRSWQRLVWQEQHRASMTGILVASCLAGAFIGSIRTDSGEFNDLAIAGVISMIAFGVGLSGFRSDSQFQQPRFLIARGISPAAIWLAKHFVWFARAFWFAGTAYVTSIASYLFSDFREVVFVMTVLPILFLLGWRLVSKLETPQFLSSRINSLSSTWLMKQATMTSRALWILGIVYFLSNWFDWLDKGQSNPRWWRFHATAAMVMIALGIRFDSNLTLPSFIASDRTSRPFLQVPNLSSWLPKVLWGLGICWIAFVAIAEMDSTLGMSHRASIRFSTGTNFPWDILCWCLLLSYGCGQLAAILSQRVTLALVFGLVMTGGSLFWLALVHLMAIPKWWALGLPVIAMLGVTLWQMKPWLLENRSWSRRWRLASALLAVPAILVMLLAYYRVAEAKSPFAIDQSLGFQFNSANSKRTPPPDNESIRLRLETLSHSKEIDTTMVVDEIIDLLKHDAIVFSRNNPQEDQSFATASRIRDLLSQQAEAYLQTETPQADALDKALECYRAILKLARSVSRGPLFAWLHGSNLQTSTLEKLVIWANHPLQTPVSIRAGIKSVESELNQFPSATDGIVESFWNDRQRWILASPTEVIEELSRLTSRERDSLGFQMLAILLPWERKRADLLMTRDAQVQFAAVWSLEHKLDSSNASARRTVTKEFASMVAANDQLARTTTLLKFYETPFGAVVGSVLRHHTTIRAGITRMELIAYRLENGKLPYRLIQLMETLDGKYLVDPWSDRLLDYYPSFLLSAGSSHSALLPVSSTEVEILHDSTSNTTGRVNFQDVTSESRQTVVLTPNGTTSLVLNRDGVTSSCLFRIPPPWIKQH